jgi:hypothetical protein
MGAYGMYGDLPFGNLIAEMVQLYQQMECVQLILCLLQNL